MKYKIVVDSCCDLTEDLKKDKHFEIIPLTLNVGETEVIDDETFDQASYLKLVKECPECPKTACPSPERYASAYEGADMVFVITLSQHLSGSFNSAQLAKNLFLEEHPDAKVQVFSSDSACCGEANIALLIQSLCEEGRGFEEICEIAADYLYHMHTYFVLETLDFLKKNGRLTGLAAIAATVLNIKPVMGADHGVIIKLSQARGLQRALSKLADTVAAEAVNPEEKRLSITHVNCPDRAEFVKELILKKIKVKDVFIVDAAGVSSTYAGDGGIVVAL